jgi:glucose-6-phosphate dehydrogenase assembly protein OpcA
MSATAVHPEKILKELANLWVDLGKEDAAKSANGVVRACSMTLLIATAGDEDAEAASETAAELMRQHPGRAISLRFQRESKDVLDSRVYARCWMPYGQHQQLCSEQIEISASMDRIPDVYSAVLGLNVPDLPVVLWLKTTSLIFQKEFDPLLRMARTVIIDTSQIEDAQVAITRVQHLAASGWRMKDLNWARLTIWREAIAQIFEQDSWLELIPSIDEVTISHRGSKSATDSLYMAAWLAARLPQAKMKFANSADTLNEGVQAVALSAGVRQASVTATSPERLTVNIDGMRHQMLLPPRADASLLNEELSILGKDCSFEQSLSTALKYTQ